MKKSNEWDSGLSSFDVENEELIEALQNLKTAKGANRDRLARELAKRFLDFADTAKPLATRGVGVHPDLRKLIVDGVRAYAAGGSFDLSVGGKQTKPPPGRPNKTMRNHAIRLAMAREIDKGRDVVAAAAVVSEELAAGNVNGLPVVDLKPAAVRSVWYASPLASHESKNENENENEKTGHNRLLLEAESFEELRRACFEFHKLYETLPPVLWSAITKFADVSPEEIAKVLSAINQVGKGSEPNDAFKFGKD